MKKVINLLDLLEKAGLDVEAFSVLSGSEKARIAAAMVAVMKLPSDSGQTVVMRPQVPQKEGRQVCIVKVARSSVEVEYRAHQSWPQIGVVTLGTEMYLGKIGEVGPRLRLANPAEMLWFVAEAKPKTSFVGEVVNVHEKDYQLLLKLRQDGSWSQEFGGTGSDSYPVLLVKVDEDFTI